MKLRSVAAFALLFAIISTFSTTTFASVCAYPQCLYVENHTHSGTFTTHFISDLDDFESPFPVKPKESLPVMWYLVELICKNHITDVNGHRICASNIHVKTDAEPDRIIGEMSIDLDTGDINPKYLSAYGYTISIPNVAGHVVIEETGS